MKKQRNTYWITLPTGVREASDEFGGFPPVSSYYFYGGGGKTASYIRREQVVELLGEDSNLIGLLNPAMELTLPACALTEEVERVPVYDWQDVFKLLTDLGRVATTKEELL